MCNSTTCSQEQGNFGSIQVLLLVDSAANLK